MDTNGEYFTCRHSREIGGISNIGRFVCVHNGRRSFHTYFDTLYVRSVSSRW